MPGAGAAPDHGGDAVELRRVIVAHKSMAVAIRPAAFAFLLLAAGPYFGARAQTGTAQPAVAITSPASGASVSGTITVTASASDDVVGVQFKYNGINFGAENATAPYSVNGDTTLVLNGSYILTAVARDAAGNMTTSAPVTITVANTPPSTRSPKFIPTFLVYDGRGPAFVAGDEQKLAKFDLLDIDRFRYNQLYPDAWSAIKNFNPNIGIYLYMAAAETSNYMDATAQFELNNLGRYDVSRGHSMGSLSGNHPELFLLDFSGSRIYNTDYSDIAGNQFWYLMDFGSTAYQSYWVESVKADIIDQPWVADGVHADNCLTLTQQWTYAASSKYPTDAAWSGAMNVFVSAIAAALHGYGQKLWCNRGFSASANGAAAWLALDAGPNPPDVVAEEGAFAVTWGAGATQFPPEPDWRRQIDTMGAVKNSKIVTFSHTKLGEGQSGTDNWGQPVTYWQTLWYSLGSFLLGKNDFLNNAHFGFFGNGASYDRIWWYPEYELIDLGSAVGPYAVATIDGTNIYWREFERGYVLVNPTASDVAAIVLPQPCRQLTHDNLSSPPLDAVTAIPLNGHNAAILLKN